MQMPKTPQKYFTGDAWTIVEKGFDPARQRVSESVFSVGNEFMGVRGYFEEGYSGDHLLGSYFNHLYELMDVQHDQTFKGFVTQGASMINTVDWLYTRITLDGEQLDLACSKFTGFLRCLDMHTGILTRQFVWHTASGKQVRLTFERFTDMQTTALGCQSIIAEPLNFSGFIQFRMGLDFNTHYEIGAGWNQTEQGRAIKTGKTINFWKCDRKKVMDGWWAIQAGTLRSEHHLFSAFRIDANQPLKTHLLEDEKFIGVEFSLTVKQGERAELEKVVVNTWQNTADIDAVWQSGLELVTHHSGARYADALKEHIAFWQKTWEKLDIEIDGDPEVLQGLRFSDFHVYQSYHGENSNLNALCKGMTGEVYFGWVFWDSEIYSHRMMMFMDPDAARKLLMYRYYRLPQALERAKELDCQGARFPFASITGTEDCGTWQHVDLEIHTDMAVAYAIWHHDKICQDKEFLYREGIEMLLQISRFLASAGGWSPQKGDFGFYGVMGPDEFHMMVNHNCYTNVMGKKTFEFTLSVLDEMKKKTPDLLARAIEKVGLTPEEPLAWQKMAQKMRILKDEKTGIYEQHAGYFDLPHVDLSHFPVAQIPIYKNWAYIKIFRHNMIKQADMLNLIYFYGQDYTLEEKRVNYEFYEARTIHESSLSPSLHAILAIELGKLDEAYMFFSYGARMDLDDYNRNTDQGLHVTSAAGVWASMVFGFGGMRTDGEILSFQPSLPARWQSYRFRVTYRSALIEVIVKKDTAEFRVMSGPSVMLKIYGQDYHINETSISIQRPAIHMDH
jgi:maltose phosphorylase